MKLTKTEEQAKADYLELLWRFLDAGDAGSGSTKQYAGLVEDAMRRLLDACLMTRPADDSLDLYTVELVDAYLRLLVLPKDASTDLADLLVAQVLLNLQPYVLRIVPSEEAEGILRELWGAVDTPPGTPSPRWCRLSFARIPYSTEKIRKMGGM